MEIFFKRIGKFAHKVHCEPNLVAPDEHFCMLIRNARNGRNIHLSLHNSRQKYVSMSNKDRATINRFGFESEFACFYTLVQWQRYAEPNLMRFELSNG